jgi:hypothetical protein
MLPHENAIEWLHKLVDGNTISHPGQQLLSGFAWGVLANQHNFFPETNVFR